MAARFKIIVLENQSLGQGLGTNWTLALWADVPAARQPFYANTAATSAWKGALASDVTALQAGAVTERVTTIQQNPGQTLSSLQPVAIAAWNAFQSEITATNEWTRYGTTWDGTTWVVATVA